MPDLKLFVWEDVLCDYTCGMACVLAHDLEEAGRLLAAKYPEYTMKLPFSEARVVSEPEAFAVHGGG
jgi:hypothetical protein